MLTLPHHTLFHSDTELYPSEKDNENFVDPGIPILESAEEALKQRKSKYQSAVVDAESKARRMGRIVKQYDDALKALKAGNPVDFEGLPTPPGYPPIPVSGASKPLPQPLSVQESCTTVSAAKPKEPTPEAWGDDSSGPAEVCTLHVYTGTLRLSA